jgi:hypothetical protein
MLHAVSMPSSATVEQFAHRTVPQRATARLRMTSSEDYQISRSERTDSSELTAPFSHLLPVLSQRHTHIHLPLAAVDRDLHRVPGAVVVHHL